MSHECLEIVDIKTRLVSDGYAITRIASLDDFYKACACLGKITQTLEVRLKEGVRQYANLPDPVPFHTDHPSVPTVAWYCVREDDNDGVNLLVDTREVVEKFSDQEKATLASIKLRVFHDEDQLMILNLNPYQVYWLPVVVEEAENQASCEEIKVIRKFREELYGLEQSHRVVSAKLRVGDALFLNNHIMLHGRRALAKNSKRFLMRVYVV